MKTQSQNQNLAGIGRLRADIDAIVAEIEGI